MTFENKTIAFANQKGGCGKTTLCTLFANYLADQGIPVCVVDSDMQHTITYIRKTNLKNEKKTSADVPWAVQAFDLRKPKTTTLKQFINSVYVMMDTASKLNGCVLFDTPGTLTEDALAAMFSKVDYIICPYMYDQATLSSTGVFIKVVDVLRQRYPDMKAKLLFVPNAVKKGVGVKEELIMWKQVKSIFSRRGVVCPKIDSKVCLQRYNTLVFPKDQKESVRECFDFIIKKMYPNYKMDER